ncbi:MULTISPECIES: hypothetical protein [unclassified Paenibacillus]|nr:hypothetical protein [Paenibacillus sp. FSL H7-0357]
MESNTTSPDNYLKELKKELKRQWPENRTLNIVCHGQASLEQGTKSSC